MTPLRSVVRHTLGVLAGGITIWAFQWLTLPLISLLPGYEAQVAEWSSLVPQTPEPLRFVLSMAIGAFLWFLPKGIAPRGSLPVGLAVVVFFVALNSREDSTPDHLRDVLVFTSAFRSVGILAAAAVMLLVRKRLPAPSVEEEEPEVVGGGA